MSHWRYIVLDQVVERAKLLMVVQEQTAAIMSKETEVSKLRAQVSQPTEQVAALNVHHKDRDTRHCFYCNQPGHTQRNCPNQCQEQRCFMCGRPGHLAKECWQGNGRGTSARGSRCPPIPVSPKRTIIVTTVKTQAANIIGKVGNVQVEMLMDSGSSISLLSQDIAKRLEDFTQRPSPQIELKTASGEILPLCNHISTQVCIQNMVSPVEHNFVVADHLITPVILGTDFLRQHELILDFSNETVGVYTKQVQAPQQELQSFWEENVKHKPHIGAIAVLGDTAVESTEECAIPDYGAVKNFELPNCTKITSDVINQYKHLFCNIPGKTTWAYHHIPTKGQPIRVPPRRVPAHYHGEVERQINEMLEQGIITQSSSPWMAPAVFVPKKSGDLHICIDYRELNKQTTKDAYPLPLPDEVQDCLAGSTIFSTLDLQSGYWQLPVRQEDQEKTAFCPGPGMGLYQFCQMSFGLTGAPSSFQRLMDSVFHGLQFVTTYIDDVLIHSSSEKQHKEHLETVFQ